MANLDFKMFELCCLDGMVSIDVTFESNSIDQHFRNHFGLINEESPTKSSHDEELINLWDLNLIIIVA